MAAATGGRWPALGDFRACPRDYWERLHDPARCAKASTAAPKAAAGGGYTGVAAVPEAATPAAPAAAVSTPALGPEAAPEVRELQELLEQRPDLKRRVVETFCVAGEWEACLKRWITQAEGEPRKEAAGQPQPTTDALFYMEEVLRLRALWHFDAFLSPGYFSEKEVADFLRVVPIEVGGCDREGSPIVWFNAGKLDGAGFSEVWEKYACDADCKPVPMTDDTECDKMNKVSRWYLAYMEYTCRQLMRRSVLENGAGSTWGRTTCVVDAGNIGMSSWSGGVKRWLVAILGAGDVAYSNMMKTTIVINVGWIVKAIWYIVKPFLAAETAAKIKFYSYSETEAVIVGDISPENLPERYGGKMLASQMMSDISKASLK